MTTTQCLDEVFAALASVHRRRLLMDLRDGHVPHLEGASRVVADGGRSGCKHLEVELFHTHLPKLDDAGFVDWDPRTGAVVRGPRFDAVEPVLRLFADHTDELPSEWV